MKWPKDTQAARNAFYGDPGKGEIAGQMVPVTPPFAMYYDGKRVKSIQFHRKAAPALLAALNEIWDACEHDQAQVDAAGVSKYAGAYNHRMVRGSKTKWSNHAYAAAIDLNALENGLYAKGNMPPFVIDAFCRQGWMWGGWYKGRKDPMHFEAVDNGGRKPKSAAPVYPKPAPRNAPELVAPAPADEFEHAEPVAPVAKPPAPAQHGPEVRGDADVWHVQRRLKAMNYNPGGLDGLWGGMTGGAISGFINDRQLAIAAPTSFEMFSAVRVRLKAEIEQAESEGFVRPVTPERASGERAVVDRAAPEAVPARRNFFLSAWAAVSSVAVAAFKMTGDYISQAWDFFTDHKDDIPTDPSLLSTAWSYVGMVPVSAWIVLAAAGFGVIAFNSFRSVQKITESVQSGERQ